MQGQKPSGRVGIPWDGIDSPIKLHACQWMDGGLVGETSPAAWTMIDTHQPRHEGGAAQEGMLIAEMVEMRQGDVQVVPVWWKA